MTTTVNSTFIQGLYTNVLQTTGDTAGINYWQAQADAGVSAADITAVFINSIQGKQAETIVRLYETFFNRAPDSTGLNTWVNLLYTGTSLQSIASAFGASPEFEATYIGTNTTTYVQEIYSNLFSRASDPVGEAYWIYQINSGAMSRTDVALAFSTSPEALLNSSVPTRFAESYLSLRAAGILEPSTTTVRALGAINSDGGFLALAADAATSALESTYASDAIHTANDGRNATIANTAAAVALATARAAPVGSVPLATQAVTDAQLAVTTANSAATIAANDVPDATIALASAIAVQNAAIAAGNLSPAAITFAATQVTISTNALAQATANTAIATSAVTAANTALNTANAALAAASGGGGGGGGGGPTLTTLSTNPATAALEATYLLNAATTTTDATNAAAANIMANSALATAVAAPKTNIALTITAVADANTAVTGANTATTAANTESANAAIALINANAVLTAAIANANDLTPAALALAVSQVNLATTAVANATTNGGNATVRTLAANAALTDANTTLGVLTTQSYLYSDGGALNNTFTNALILPDGAGVGTLNLNSSIVAAMTLGFGGQDWNIADTGYRTLNITNDDGAGAISLTSSAAFNGTFNTGSLILRTSILAAGVTNITLDGSVVGSTAYGGTATINASNTLGAGAINILAGSGDTVVSNVAALNGVESVGGAGLISVTMTSNNGAQNVGTTGASASRLATVVVTQNGAGDQTIISTNNSAVSVTATMGLTSTAGNQTITTGAGNDTITLVNNGGFTLGTVIINAKGGANTISLAATHTGIDTVINNTGTWTVGTNQTTSINTITNFTGVTDILQLSQAAYGANSFGATGGLGVVLNSHIGVLANTATIVNAGLSSLAGGTIDLSTSGALVLVGTNTIGNALAVYAVDKTANASSTIADQLALHTATLVGHVSIIGQALTAADFVVIA